MTIIEKDIEKDPMSETKEIEASGASENMILIPPNKVGYLDLVEVYNSTDHQGVIQVLDAYDQEYMGGEYRVSGVKLRKEVAVASEDEVSLDVDEKVPLIGAVQVMSPDLEGINVTVSAKVL